LMHFLRFGWKEGRDPSPYFNTNYYLNQNQDVRKAGINPLVHFLQKGLAEGRKANPVFTISLLAVEHCNNKCSNCSASSPYSGIKFNNVSSFFQSLDLLESEQVPFLSIAISGGEPFLHPDIDGFIHELKARYPSKIISVTTNFFWANESTIRTYAPIIRSLNSLEISLYPNLIKKVGSRERVYELIDLLKGLCPACSIIAIDREDFLTWDLHEEKGEVEGKCVASDCFTLRPDGFISHCSI